MKYLLPPAIIALFLLFNSCSSSEDECKPITCLNEGVQTIDCGCDCPEGYSGVDCRTIETPKEVTIEKVVINSFDDATNWDLSTKPDITFSLEKTRPNGRGILDSHPTYIENASSSVITFNLSPKYSTTDVNTPIIFAIYDYDGNDIIPNADDIMNFGAFFPFNGTSFPEKIKVTGTNLATDVDIYVSYK